MRNKSFIISCFFLLISIVIFTTSIVLNSGYINRLNNSSSALYQLKAVGSVLVLFLIGYLALKALQHTFNDRWILLLSMPVGIALWVLTAEGLLLFDIVLYQYRVYILLFIFIFLVYFSRIILKKPIVGSLLPDKCSIMIILGISLIVSTGWNYVVMNYDSYLYFANYGKALTLLQEWKAFNTQNAYVLTNIGQFLPLLNSYASYWGLDYCLPVLSFLFLNISAIFYLAVYEMYYEKMSTNKAIFGAGLLTFLLITCTAFFVYSNWLLSNSFLMVYLFIAALLGSRSNQKMSLDCIFVLILCSLSITLLRKDGIILVCFVFICYACKEIFSPKWLVISLIPSMIVQFLYIFLLKKVIYASTDLASGTSVINNEMILLTLVVVIGTLLFLLVIHPLLPYFIKGQIYKIIVIGMLSIVVLFTLLKPGMTIDHIDAVFHVLTGDSYGFSLLTWALLLCVALQNKFEWDYDSFFVIGYCILVFLIYWNKGNTEKGIDNSGMRSFYQVIPFFFYWMGRRIRYVFEEK